MMKKTLSVFLILVLVAGCARHDRIVSGVSSGFSSREARIGSEIHHQILETYQVNQDPVLNEYVQTIGQKIASESRRRDLQYQFVVLEDDRIYAMHAPGGYVYITTGFFRFLQSEIELAGILAHEVGTLQFKDPRFSVAKKAFENLIRIGGTVGPAFGGIGTLAVMGLVLIGIFVGREKSIDKKIQDADEKALVYMAKSGFDPQGLVNPLRRMRNPDYEFRPYLYDYLQSHPITDERFQNLEDAFGKLDLASQKFEAGREAYITMTESVAGPIIRR